MTANYFHMLDADIWEEMPKRNVQANGYAYVGRKYHDDYEVKIFVKRKDK